MSRRQFAAVAAAMAFDASRANSAAPFPVQYARRTPSDVLMGYVEPGSDLFTGEKEASEIEKRLYRIFAGTEAAPAALRGWVARRTEIRWSRFHVVPDGGVRFEIALAGRNGLEHHTGVWILPDFTSGETLATVATRPWFRDVTAHVFGRSDSFQQQLLHGNPWWRARLDSAAGIDVDGNQGIAVADIDNDGADEIYVCQSGGLPNRLYKLDANGVAIDITHAAGLDILDDSTCALFADFRNSGVQDLVVLRRSGPLMFLNRGDGVFVGKPDAFRFHRSPQGAFTGMAAADYDRDGRVDLYLCTYVYVQGEDVYQYPSPYHDAQNGPPNYLLRNRATADGLVFEDVTEESGIDQNNNRFTFSASWCDFDGDGWPDLYVANDFGRNNLYRNRGGRFTDEAARAGVEDIGAGMSACWFDYDGDGRPDLYVSNMWSAAGQRVVRDAAFAPAAGNEEAYRRHAKGNSLYRNKGDGTFEETGAREGVEMGRWAWSSGGFDFDLDGSAEIFIASGMVTNGIGGGHARSDPESSDLESSDLESSDLESFFWRQVVARSPTTAAPRTEYENAWNAIAQLFRGHYNWNGGERNVFYVRRAGHYQDASGVSGLDFADDSRAFAVTDFDGDGYPDIVLKSRLAPQIRALQNDCAAGRPAFALRLRGTKSNRDAIGARVIVNGRMQEVTAGSGFLSQHSKRLHFGLGVRDRANVIVLWPSGLRQELGDLEPGYTWTVVEGVDKPARVPFRPRVTDTQTSVTGINDASFSDTWLLDPVPDPGQHAGPSIVLLYAGKAPAEASAREVQALDLSREPGEVAAAYALFRRYLFEYRVEYGGGLELPLALLVDGESRVRRVYATVPSERMRRADLDTVARLSTAQIRSLALPFAGRYFTEPARNYFKLGAAFYQAGYSRRALAYLDEALRATPGNWRALLAQGEIHRELGEMDAALQAFRRALAIQPNHAPAMVSTGIVLLAKGDGAGARAMFTKAMDTDPLCADAANQMGLLSIRAGDMDDARGWFQRAIEAQPNHSGALNNLGVLFAQKGQYADSIAVFRFGIERLPDDEPLYLNLARVYAMAGQRESSLAIVNQLLERKPDSEAGRKLLSDMTVR